ncbi:response regulator [Myxococcota bacterium]
MSKRLLICDDSAFSRSTIRKAIPEGLNLETTETSSGEDAVRLCVTGEVDILLLDLNMPGIDGFEVLQQLRDQGFSGAVVVITANIQSAPAQRAKALGARVVVQKPINAERLAQLFTYLDGEASP